MKKKTISMKKYQKKNVEPEVIDPDNYERHRRMQYYGINDYDLAVNPNTTSKLLERPRKRIRRLSSILISR